MAKQQVFIDFDPTKAQIKTIEFVIQDRNRVFFFVKNISIITSKSLMHV